MPITADQLAPANSGSLAAASSLTATFNTNPSGSSVVLVPVWTSQGGINTTFSISDNASNTYALDTSVFAPSGMEIAIYRTQNPALPGVGTLQVTIKNTGSSSAVVALGGRSYTGMQSRMETPAATNWVSSGTNNSVTISPKVTSELFFSIFNISVNTNPVTPSMTGVYAIVSSITNGTTGEVGGFAEFISTDTNAQTASWSTSGGGTYQTYALAANYPPVINAPPSGVVLSNVAIKRASFF